MYLPKVGTRVGLHVSGHGGAGGPKYHFGGVRVEIDKRFSPAPGTYGYAQARSLGPQKIDSTRASLPMFGMGAATREVRDRLHLAKYHASNISSRTLLGGSISSEVAAPPSPPTLAASTAAGTASRENLGRALAVALAAEQAEADPVLAAALATLHKRVGTLREQAQS